MTSAIRESIQSCLMRMLLVLLSLGIYKGFGSPVSGMQSKAKHENKRSSYLSGNHECFSSSVPAPEGQRHISVFLSPPHSSPQISISFKNRSNTIFLCLKFCSCCLRVHGHLHTLASRPPTTSAACGVARLTAQPPCLVLFHPFH